MSSESSEDLPLKVIGSRILVFSVGTERAHVPRRVMDKTMSNHLILPLETLPTFTARTTFHATIMWSVRGMHICMRIEEIL